MKDKSKNGKKVLSILLAVLMMFSTFSASFMYMTAGAIGNQVGSNGFDTAAGAYGTPNWDGSEGGTRWAKWKGSTKITPTKY